MMASRQVRSVETFLAALQSLDATPIEELLTEDVVEILPLAASGEPEPAAVFTGRDAVVHVQTVLVDTFSTVEFADPVVTEASDGRTVFVEARGRRVQDSGRVYENIYLLKFDFRDELICRITEYSNPVAFAKFFDQPLG